MRNTVFMDYPKNSSVPKLAIVSLLIAGVISISIFGFSMSIHKPLFLFRCPQCLKQPKTTVAEETVDALEAALRAAATADGTVIITVVNRAYTEQNDAVGKSPTMLDLFLEGFWLGDETRGLLDHLLVVAVDRTAYDRCMFRRLHCFRLETEGVEFGGEKLYMSEDFIKMMWRRTLFLSEVLRRGYSFIFTDTDIMWLRNPLLRLNTKGTEDLQISTDRFNGNPRSETNLINTGFYYVRSNNKTAALFSLWHASKNRFPHKKEQDVLIELMHEGVFRNLTLNVRFLDTLYFSGFCQDSRDIRVLSTVHANCCRSITAKVADLSTVLRAWKRFWEFSGNRKVAVNGSAVAVPWSHFHVACAHSWATNVNSTNAN